MFVCFLRTVLSSSLYCRLVTNFTNPGTSFGRMQRPCGGPLRVLTWPRHVSEIAFSTFVPKLRDGMTVALYAVDSSLLTNLLA